MQLRCHLLLQPCFLFLHLSQLCSPLCLYLRMQLLHFICIGSCLALLLQAVVAFLIVHGYSSEAQECLGEVGDVVSMFLALLGLQCQCMEASPQLFHLTSHGLVLVLEALALADEQFVVGGCIHDLEYLRGIRHCKITILIVYYKYA